MSASKLVFGLPHRSIRRGGERALERRENILQQFHKDSYRYTFPAKSIGNQTDFVIAIA